MKADTVMHRQDESKLQGDLVELNRKINHWRDKENEVKFKLCKYLNEKADILNQMQATEESQKAKLLFEQTFKIEPSQYDEFGVYDMEQWEQGGEVEVYVCKETLWHYLYFPNDADKQYYMLIGRCDQYFDTLKGLQDWAKPQYFQ